MAGTNRQRAVVVLLNPETQRVNVVGVAAPVEAHPEWLLVLAFRVGGGRTELVLHAVMPTPGDWADEPPPGKAEGAYGPREKWLSGWVGRMPTLGEPGQRVTASLIRATSVGELERWARGFVQMVSGTFWRDGSAGDPQHKPRGPRGSGDARLARIAARYVELCADETVKRPRLVLSEEEHLAENTIRSYLYRARDNGLLTSEGQGRAGGELTPKAKALLAETIGENDGQH